MGRVPDFLDNRVFRYAVTPFLYILLAVMIPRAGWNPLLLLWIVNLAILLRGSGSRAMKRVYAVLVALASLLVVFNLVCRLVML